MAKRPDPHPVDPRRQIRPDKPEDYQRGRRDGDQHRQQGGGKK